MRFPVSCSTETPIGELSAGRPPSFGVLAPHDEPHENRGQKPYSGPRYSSSEERSMSAADGCDSENLTTLSGLASRENATHLDLQDVSKLRSRSLSPKTIAS